MTEPASPLAIPQAPQRSLPSATSLFGWSFSFYKKRFLLITGIILVPTVFGLIEIIIGKTSILGLTIIFTIIGFIIGLLSRLALFSAVIEENQSVAGAFKRGLPLLIPFAWINILTGLVVLGGSLLLIIPGIFLAVCLSLSFYALFAENQRGISALTASWHYVKGFWGAVFWRLLFLTIILALISLVVGLVIGTPSLLISLQKDSSVDNPFFSQLFNLLFNNFFILPFSIIYTYGLYRALKEIKASSPLESDEMKIRKNIKIFLIIGIIGLIALIAFSYFVLFKLLFPFLLPTNSPSF